MKNEEKKMKRFLIFPALLLTFAACKKQEYVNARGDKVEVEQDGKSVKVTTKDGSAVYTGGSGTVVPADFPKDVPIYPGANVTASVSGSQTTGGGHMVTFETGDSPDKVTDFYKAKLSGWKTSMEMATGNGKMLILTSPDDKRSVSVIASPSGGKTQVSLTAAEKP
jgi:hypothetical protein